MHAHNATLRMLQNLYIIILSEASKLHYIKTSYKAQHYQFYLSANEPKTMAPSNTPHMYMDCAKERLKPLPHTKSH